jgi:hypothetical protein
MMAAHSSPGCHGALLAEKAQAKAAQQSRKARRQQGRPRALVTTADDDDDGDATTAHSWWACTLTTASMNAPPPLMANDLGTAAELIAANPAAPMLLTPHQAQRMGVTVQQQQQHERTPPKLSALPQEELEPEREIAPPPVLAGRHAMLYSSEYIYKLSDLVACSDRSFRKAVARMEAVVQGNGLQLGVHSGQALTKALVGQCMRCRNVWEKRRAASRVVAAERSAAGSGTERVHLPPRKTYYLSAVTSHGLLQDGSPNPDIALFVITRPPQDGAASTPISAVAAAGGGAVLGYLVTERVGCTTVVSVDGVHDYSVGDARECNRRPFSAVERGVGAR